MQSTQPQLHADMLTAKEIAALRLQRKCLRQKVETILETAVTQEKAEDAGYAPITTAVSLYRHDEIHFFIGVLADMKPVAHLVVRTPEGLVEIWRLKKEMKLNNKNQTH